MQSIRTAFLHYSASPVVGGVEAVLDAHARVFLDAGYPVTMIAGRGHTQSLPDGTELVVIPEMDTQHPRVQAISAELNQGRVPVDFAALRDELAGQLRPLLKQFDVVVIHNVLTKHFNLPLTAALAHLLEEGILRNCLGWSHDFTWTSPHSRGEVFDGEPWDLLRTALPGVQYVTISEQRLKELSDLLGISQRKIRVIYNGVDPKIWFGLSETGSALIREMDLLSGDVIMIMPVRVTQAKNIELAARVLAALKSEACQPRLVVTGPPDPHSAESMDYYRALLDLRTQLGLARELHFVFEMRPGERAGEYGLTIPQPVVADLLRVSDVVFLPSHREGFGMPVLEAGLIGTPVVSSTNVPAAQEIGGKDVYLFDPHADPSEIAQIILNQALNHPGSRLRRQVRQNLTWERLFQQKIRRLLHPAKNPQA